MTEKPDSGTPRPDEDNIDPGLPILEIRDFEIPLAADFGERIIHEIERRIVLGDLLKLYLPFQLEALRELSLMVGRTGGLGETRRRRR